MDKRILFSGVAAIGTLTAAFLSQQASMRVNGSTFVSAAANQAKASVSKGTDWVMSKIGDNVQSGGEVIKKQAEQATEQTTDATKKVSDSLVKKVENYFSNIGNSIVGKTPETNCPTQ